MKNWLQVITINIAIFCTLLVLLEIGGQFVFYLKHGHFIFDESIAASKRHKLLFEIHPYIAGRLKKNRVVHYKNKTISTTDEHTRWTGAPNNDADLIRVAVIGGSTTFGSGVTDVDSWPAILQKKLGDRYSVTNYGGPGYSTAEAIVLMSLVVPEKKPHFVVHYHGWNDIRNYHEQDLGIDYYSHGYRQYSNLGISLYEEKTAFEKLQGVSSIVWLVANIKSKISEPKKENPPETYTINDPFVDRIYRRNLESLLILSARNGAKVLFVPQVLNYKDYEGKKGSDKWSRHIENSSMPTLMDKFNLIMEGICPENKTDCVFLSNVLSEDWENSDFIDNGHFSRNGGEKFAEILGKEIQR